MELAFGPVAVSVGNGGVETFKDIFLADSRSALTKVFPVGWLTRSFIELTLILQF